ncbi:MAG: 4Fe-4S binding protein [Thermoplasmatales archaeon]|nr:4Fe-4S binding protein [Thermoplasmatales archaeon]
MKRLLILSGKGGTGKTTVAGAFIRLSGAEAYADCDVDAPNLHLTMGWDVEPDRAYHYGLDKAVIDSGKCIGCGLCMEKCRFGAIVRKAGGYAVDPLSCEGCAVCELVCPNKAVRMEPAVAGDLMLYADGRRAFSTARLRMGSGTSGKLVTEVKKRMDGAAPDAPLAIIDGSPGIGCPVIASLSGVDLALIVAEPSVSGISDMGRIVETAGKSGVPVAVCVNKHDTNPGNTAKIEDYCKERGLPFVGRIPFDPAAVVATNDGMTVVDVDCPAGTAVREVYRGTLGVLSGAGGSAGYRGKIVEIE